MRRFIAIGSVAVLLVGAALLSGCARHSEPADEDVNASAGSSRFYFEVPKNGVIYVVGSVASMDTVMAGKPLPSQVSAYGPNGQPIVFETDARGLEHRLRAEYARRHPVD